VVVVDVDASGRAADRIGATDAQAIALTADVTKPRSQAAVDTALGAYRTLDMPHINVGVNRPGDPLDMTPAELQAHISPRSRSTSVSRAKRRSNLMVGICSVAATFAACTSMSEAQVPLMTVIS